MSSLKKTDATFVHPFYFLRHGETHWNFARQTQGQLDSQLNENGRNQALNAADILAQQPIERIVASPLSRARDTAQAVASRHGLEITFDDGLKECHLGDLQGQPHGPWLADYWTGDFTPPNGESFDEFSERVWSAMARAVARGPNTLIVAHGGLWIAAHGYTMVRPGLMPMPNALPLRIVPNGDVWQHEIL